MSGPAPYRAPRWLPGGHAQTIYPQLLRRDPVSYHRERWTAPDGDFVDVDYTAQASGAKPLVALFHGLEGSSSSAYAVTLMRAAVSRGWRGAVPHFRGCSGEMNLLPRAYHSGDHEEVDWIVRRLVAANGSRPIMVVGVSLGGSALLNWLGRHGESARALVASAAAVCAPIDLPVAGNALGRGFNRVYAEYFLRSMRPKALAKLARHPGLYPSAAVAACRTLRQFDDIVTAPLHGFRNCDDYWQRASSKPWLRGIRVPTLILNAANDPFMPAHALPRAAEVAPEVRLVYTRSGGHVGYPSGPFPGRNDWLPAMLLDFLASCASEAPDLRHVDYASAIAR